MSLSIYSIKHPLVLNWTSSIHYSNVSSRHKYKFFNNVGLALIYEATRKSIQTINLSINCINKYKSISILPQKLSYLILIDISFYQVLSQDIHAILPSTIIYPMYPINTYSKDATLSKDSVLEDILFKSDRQNFIILIQHLNNYYSNRLLSIFQKNQCIYSKIQICCVTCSTEALQLLNNQKYNLDIYTAKILDNA